MEPVAVGLVGAGRWASVVHAPVLAAGPATRLAGVWSRSPGRAGDLAHHHGVPAFDRFEALLDGCEAVAFAVRPDAQPDLAVAAARAGKALLLEKPLAFDCAGATRIADAVAEAGVGSVVVLTYRFVTSVREFLSAAADFDAVGGRACFLSGAYLGGPYATGWRLERGCLLDVGPHVVDLAAAALGPVVGVRAHGDVHGWVGLQLDHVGGAVSEVAMTCRAAIDPSRTEVEVFGPGGNLRVDGRRDDRAVTFATMATEFAAAARAGGGHPCDAAHGLELQRIIDAATADLARAR